MPGRGSTRRATVTATSAEVVRSLPPSLVHSSDDEPGIRRTGTKRFTYRDEVTGRDVRGRAALDRIAALAVPPAWTDVWICREANGHIQATGRDDRGRKQYRYHPDYRARRDAEKFADLVPFGEALGPLRKQLRLDLRRRTWDCERVLALVVALLDTTLVRVGNEGYARENGSYGLTTLRNRHLRDNGRRPTLRFSGKSGLQHEIEIEDPALARLVRRCHQLPGHRLFQWVDDDGTSHPVRSDDVNARLRELTGLDVTAKTFRTWGATTRAASLLAVEDPPGTDREARATVVRAVDEVAEVLGNTRAVARSAYVAPVVVTAYEAGRLQEWWAKGPSRPAGGLVADERRLLSVLRRARRAGL
jgi:DNA topoisomerase I